MSESNDSGAPQSDDRELATWRGEWQALGGKDDLARDLVARAARDGRGLRRSAAAEVLAAICSTTFVLWLVVRSHGSVEAVVVAAVILLFNGGWLTQFFTMRAGLFGSSGEGVDSFVELTRKRLAVQLRWMTAARRWTLAIAIVLVPWAISVFLSHKARYLAEPWRAVVGFGGAFGIFGAVYAVTVIKARRVQREAEAFERHVAEVQLA